MNSLSREILTKDVRRNREYEDVVNILVHGALEGGGGQSDKRIFSYIKDLMIFAAMVGKKYERTQSVSKENIGITLQTYSGVSSKNSISDQQNIIFMFGLLTYKDMNKIRDENIDDCIKVFEEYCNGGLSLIKEWLIASGWNSLCLIEKILDESMVNSSDEIQVSDNPFD